MFLEFITFDDSVI